MDVEKIIVKYLADATQFNAVTDATEKRLELFSSRMTGLGRRIFEVIAGGIVIGVSEVVGRVGDMLEKVSTKVGNTYRKLESRYGKNWAKAILGAGLLGLPVPLPGASLLFAGPFLALAELTRRLSGLNLGKRLQFGLDFGKAFLSGFWEAIREGVGDLLGKALQKGSVPLGIATGMYNSVAKALAPVRNLLGPIFADMWQGIITRSFLQGRVGQAVVTGFQSAMGGAVAQRIGGILSAIWAAPIVQAIPGVVMGAARRALSGVQSLVGGAFGAGRAVVGAGASAGLQILGGAGSLMGSLLSGGFSALLAPAKFALLGLGAAAAFAAYEAVKLAAEYENASVSFTVMTGSAEKAKGLLDDLTKLAVESPFKSGELIKGAQTLKAYGVETEDLLDTLKVLGDVASGGSGGSLDERLGRLVLAFGQTITQGKLMGQELRQFSNAGAPLIENIAKVVGRPVESVRGMVEAGRIGTREVTQALNMMVGPTGRFFNLMDERSKTVEGRWSAFVENVQVGLRNLGLSFFRGFGLADLLNDWGNATKEMGGQTTQLEGFFMKLREVFDMVTAAATAMATVIGGMLTEAIQAMTGAMPDWTDMKSSIDSLIQAAIIGFGKVIELLQQVAKAAAPILKAAGEAAMLVGATPDDGKAGSVFSAARKDGNSFVRSLLISGGAGVRDLLLGTDTRQELVGLDKISPRVNPFAGGIAALENFGNNAVNPADRIMEEYKRLRQTEDMKNSAARTGGSFYDYLFKADSGKPGYSHITTRYGPSADAMKMIGEINKAFAEGATPLAKFRNELTAFQSAATNGLPAPLLNALRIMGLAPVPRLTEEQQVFQAGKMLEQIRSQIGDRGEIKFPGLAMKGSVEAQETINRTQYGQRTMSVQEEIREGIKELQRLQEEELKQSKEALEEFRRLGFAIPGEI